MFSKLLAVKKRTAFRSLIAGLLSHYIALAVMITLIWLIRPFAWAAIYGVPYQASTGPANPSSPEGTFLQIVGLISWIPGGLAAAHWSPSANLRCLIPILAYMVGITLIAALGGDVPSMSPARTAWYWLSGPVGAIAGALLNQRLRGGGDLPNL